MGEVGVWVGVELSAGFISLFELHDNCEGRGIACLDFYFGLLFAFVTRQVKHILTNILIIIQNNANITSIWRTYLLNNWL